MKRKITNPLKFIAIIIDLCPCSKLYRLRNIIIMQNTFVTNRNLSSPHIVPKKCVAITIILIRSNDAYSVILVIFIFDLHLLRCFFILRKLISRRKIHNYEPAQKTSNFKINKKVYYYFYRSITKLSYIDSVHFG